jgi:hypothetical protein
MISLDFYMQMHYVTYVLVHPHLKAQKKAFKKGPVIAFKKVQKEH